MAATFMFLDQPSLQSQELSLVDTFNEIRLFGGKSDFSEVISPRGTTDTTQGWLRSALHRLVKVNISTQTKHFIIVTGLTVSWNPLHQLLERRPFEVRLRHSHAKQHWSVPLMEWGSGL